jgi:putative transposase
MRRAGFGCSGSLRTLLRPGNASGFASGIPHVGVRRDELLNLWELDYLREARVLIEDWRISYNINRPHTAHGDLTPTEFAAAWATKNQPRVA